MALKTFKIISIEKLKRKGYYELKLANATNESITSSITINDDIIVNYNLHKNLIIDEIDYNNILKDNTLVNYYLKTMNYITFKMRSLKEIELYLEKFNLDSDSKNNIIEKLTKQGFINDLELSKILLESTIAKKKGPKYYNNKLFEKKIPLVFQQDYHKDIEEEVIIKVIENLKDKYISLPKKMQYNKLYTKLVRDGFSIELVRSILAKQDFKSDILETLTKDIEKIKRRYQDLSNVSNMEKKKIEAKIIQSLLRKGYSYQDIKKRFVDFEWNDE